MKIFSVLFMGACLSVQASAFAQQTRVTLAMDNVTLNAVFAELRKQTRLDFFYNSNVTRSKGKVSVKAEEKEVRQVLDELLPGLGLEYYVDDELVIIREKEVQQQPQAAVARRQLLLRGKVTDKDANPLPGVTVRLKGTKTGTATDRNGAFLLPVPEAENIVLQFSFVGMEPVEMKYTGQQLFNVVMREEVSELEDVVVTGYANIRKSSFTGTATRVTRDELLKVSTGNVLQALQVFDPSLRTVRNNEMGSDPNTLPEFNIRGAAGVGITELDRIESADVSQFALKNNPNLPVFILDGYEVSTEKIYDMDPNRIDGITILKDAAATAMYGSRAANGVIVIETVAPKPGELRVTYNLTGTFTAPDLSSYDMMNAQEKLDMEVAAGLIDEGSSFNQRLTEYRAKVALIGQGVDTYWLSQPLQTEVNHRHSLYLEGGAETVRFGLGLNYDAESGVMKKSYRDRMGAELRVDYRVQGIQVTDNASFSRMKSQQSPYGTFSDYVRMPPYAPPYDLTTGQVGQYYTIGNVGRQNPMYHTTVGNYDRSGYDQFANNLSINAFFLDYFQLKFQFAVNYTMNHREEFFDPNDVMKYNSYNSTPTTRGELYLDESTAFSWNSNLMLMYNRNIGDHNLNLNLAVNANEDRSTSSSFAYRGFPSSQFHDPKYANSMLRSPSFGDDNSRLIGGFLMGNYTYRDTYLFDVSVRTDGSSKFGSKQRFAPFWSFGAGINLHKYDFLKNSPVVTNARLKGNYGQTGRVSFSPYAARNTYQVLMDDWYTTGMGGTLMGMGNEDLTWDNVNTLNLGFDVSLWNRLTVNFSWYDKRTKDMITSVTIPSASGFTSYMDNMGEVSNKGFEVMLNYAIVKGSDWNVNVSANGAHNKNKIVKISDALKEYNDRVDKFYDDYRESYLYWTTNGKYLNPVRKYEEGGSEYAIFGMQSLGISPENGAELFLNRDGSVSYDWEASQQVIIGNTEPALQGSFALNARYKGFSLYTTFMYEFGGDLYNSTLVSNVESIDVMVNNVDRRALTMRWQKPGDVTPLKSIADRYVLTRPTSRFVQKNNTLTFNSLSLGYDMDRSLTARLGLSMVRVQFTMNEIAVLSTIHQERGTSYPFARKFGFTLNASF